MPQTLVSKIQDTHDPWSRIQDLGAGGYNQWLEQLAQVGGVRRGRDAASHPASRALCSNPACHAPHCPAISALPPHSDAPHKTVPYPPMPHTIYIGFTNSVYGASMHGTVHVLHTVSFALIEHTHTYIHTLSCPKSDTHYKLLYVSYHRMVVHSVPWHCPLVTITFHLALVLKQRLRAEEKQ